MKTLVMSVRLKNLLQDKSIKVKKQNIYIDIPMFADVENIGNHFDIRKGEISFFPSSKGTQPISEAGKWTREGRQTMKAGKFAKLLNYSFHIEGLLIRTMNLDNICEQVSNIIKGDKHSRFFVSSYISKVYEMKCADGSGYLLNSCMRNNSGHECRHNSSFYDGIPALKILYGKNENEELTFRALLWLVENNDKTEKKIFLDRIYGSDDVNTFLQGLAKERGWLYREFSDNDIKNGDSGYYYFNTKVDMRERGEHGTPYMDTLTDWHNIGFLSNKSGDVCVQECSGDAFTKSAYSCYHCECAIDEREVRYDHNDNVCCDSCFDENSFCCCGCNDIYRIEDVIEHNGSLYCTCCAESKNIHYCDECGSYEKGCNWIEGENLNVCDDCIDNFYYCDECNEYSREVTEINGNCYCNSCRDANFVKCDECDEYIENGGQTEAEGLIYCDDCKPISEEIINEK